MGKYYDIKDFTECCPKCGKYLFFQTQEEAYEENAPTFEELELNLVGFQSVRTFFGYCWDCRITIQYHLKEVQYKRTIDDYERTETLDKVGK